MKFFNLDLHASVIKDLADIFERMGHTVDNWSISAHAWVHEESTKAVDVVNQYTWKHLNEYMCERFYNRYREELSQYDGFIVTHTPAFALLYLKFNKPIIIVASTRYEAPFSFSKRNWEWLNNCLRELSKNSLVYRIANNKYDQKYCELFTQLSWTHIPSYCGYFNNRWNPVVNKFLIDSRFIPDDFNKPNYISKKSLGTYEWKDIVKYMGIIVIPYNVSVMSVFEYYLAGIPLFFPSKKFCMELYRKFHNDGVLSELSWLQVYKVNYISILKEHEKDPNDYLNMEVIEQWISLSDWYDVEWMPHIIYFDSFQDLERKTKQTNLKKVSDLMLAQNNLRKFKIEELWKSQLNLIGS